MWKINNIGIYLKLYESCLIYSRPLNGPICMTYNAEEKSFKYLLSITFILQILTYSYYSMCMVRKQVGIV